jgi:hypothetical protein
MLSIGRKPSAVSTGVPAMKQVEVLHTGGETLSSQVPDGQAIGVAAGQAPTPSQKRAGDNSETLAQLAAAHIVLTFG